MNIFVTHALFVCQGTGTEQHRHHCVEVAVYYLLAMMWEAESGTQYKMTKSHDIYSGLGSSGEVEVAKEASPEPSSEPVSDLCTIVEASQEDDEKGDVAEVPVSSQTVSGAATTDVSERLRDRVEQRKREDQIAKEISRAEAIVANCEGIKVPLPCHAIAIQALRPFVSYLSYCSHRFSQCMETHPWY